MKKYIFGAVLSIGLLVSPALTQASGLTTVQINSIISLLQSFGADQSVINSVQVALNGGTQTTATENLCHTFNYDLTVGSSGDEVLALTRSLYYSSGLNATGYYSTFTENTAADVVKFQAKYGIRQTGYVGPITRAKLNSLYGCTTSSNLTVVSVEALAHTPSNYLNKKVQTTGKLINTGTNYFTDSVFAVTDGTNIFQVSAWLPLEVAPAMSGSVGGQPSTMATNLDKVLTFEGVVEQNTQGYFLRVTKATLISLTVLSPNGGETWIRGTTQAITWQDSIAGTGSCPTNAICAPTPKSYDIYLVPFYVSTPCDGVTIKCMGLIPAPYQITMGVSGSLYSWLVGQGHTTYYDTNTVPDGQYTIRVCQQSSTSICGSSDGYFNIVSGTTQTPSISSLSPLSGPTGTFVTVTASGLDSSSAVYFNGYAVSPTAITDYIGIRTSIGFTVPSSLGPNCTSGLACPQYLMLINPGTYNVQIVNANGKSNVIPFTVTVPSCASGLCL